ncbi:MAG TPA: serine/threonine-protein kinase [Kofleriaceae bacterium]|nr:serine/threonine-protein kinase [Kofleriaceae bacterium]
MGADDPVDLDLVGRVFEGRYELRALLGAGGMGAVYRGRQRSVDREVAIKVIDPKLASKRDGVKRFLREAKLSSRLSAPSIVSVYDFGQTEDGILYIVMELVPGRTLARHLEPGHPIGVARAIRIGLQLCDALETAHAAGIVHRDLKPHNVIILDQPPGRDVLKVLDFGLAKSLTDEAVSLITHAGAMIGTPLYMSPELIQGKPCDVRADIYSLGCMLHEMTSGVSPFAAPTVEHVLSNHIYELSQPLPDDLPPMFAELIRRSIAKDVAERPANAAEVRAALLAIRAVRPGPRRRWWIGASAAIVLASGATTFAIMSHDRASSRVDSDAASGIVGSDAASTDGTPRGIPVDALAPIEDAAGPSNGSGATSVRDSGSVTAGSPRGRGSANHNPPIDAPVAVDADLEFLPNR